MKMFATLLVFFPLGVLGLPLGLLGSGSERRELLQEKVCYYQVPLDDRVEEKYYDGDDGVGQEIACYHHYHHNT